MVIVDMGGPSWANPDDKWCVSVALWRRAWRWKTLNAVPLRRSDPTRRRLNGGHRCLGRRRWDDLVQRHVDAAKGEDTPWHEATQVRDAWCAMEADFVAGALRRAIKTQILQTTWMLKERET